MNSMTILEKHKYLIPQEYRQLLRVTRNRRHKNNHRDYIFLLLGGMLGLRINELLQLKVCNFMFKNNYSFVKIATLKQRTPTCHDLPVTEMVRRKVKRFIKATAKRENDFLFTNKKNEPLTDRTMEKVFKTLCRLAGLDSRLSPHSLRHCRGVVVFEATKDVKQVQISLRHKNLATSSAYIHSLHEQSKVAEEIEKYY